ncbi:MAG: ABC transporter permease subunit [Acidobacteriaceae bacterium]|nr:ABC transporter permease subunit [Acidobacteriaceae bacterium]
MHLNHSRVQVGWALISDTFQEARARWLFAGLFALSSLLIAIFLFVLKIDLVEGAISLMGIESTQHYVNIRSFVNNAYAFISIFLYTWGTFLAVFASSGLIPSVLEPGRISLLLSKPITRPMLLLGRYVGNLLVITLNHVYLVASIWLIIGLKTGIWEKRFLLAIPITLFIFAILLCVVVLVGVLSESAALSVMISVALMLISAILAQTNFMLRVLNPGWPRRLWMALYWIVPKVYDLANAMKQIIVFDRQANWWTPVWTSLLFGTVILSTALYAFQKRDF